MNRIIDGVRYFQANTFPPRREEYESLAQKQQTPEALFITCSDSRVVPADITGSKAGALFHIRNAGNIVPPFGAGKGGEAATIEYALGVLGIRNIIVCGHSQCGAIKAMMDNHDLSEFPGIAEWFSHASATRQILARKYPTVTGPERHMIGTEENVLVQLNNISTHPMVATLLATGELRMAGWYYDIATGAVLQYSARTGRFESLVQGDEGVTPVLMRTAEPAGALR